MNHVDSRLTCSFFFLLFACFRRAFGLPADIIGVLQKTRNLLKECLSSKSVLVRCRTIQCSTARAAIRIHWCVQCGCGSEEFYSLSLRPEFAHALTSPHAIERLTNEHHHVRYYRYSLETLLELPSCMTANTRCSRKLLRKLRLSGITFGIT